MKRKTKIQKIKVVSSKQFRGGESSPYWEYINSRGHYGMDDDLEECAQANPNILRDTRVTEPSTPQLLMGEAIQHLQGRQKEVYILTMREGKSLAEAGQILGIEKSSIQKYRERAIKFLTAYCKEAIKRGRV